MRGGRSAACPCSPSDCQVSCADTTATATISASATAIQSKRAAPDDRAKHRDSGRSRSRSSGCAYQGRQGRSSVRNSCSGKTARGGKPFFAGQICGRGRIPSGHGSKRSLHGQSLSRPISGSPLNRGLQLMLDARYWICPPVLPFLSSS